MVSNWYSIFVKLVKCIKNMIINFIKRFFDKERKTTGHNDRQLKVQTLDMIIDDQNQGENKGEIKVKMDEEMVLSFCDYSMRNINVISETKEELKVIIKTNIKIKTVHKYYKIEDVPILQAITNEYGVPLMIKAKVQIFGQQYVIIPSRYFTGLDNTIGNDTFYNLNDNIYINTKDATKHLKPLMITERQEVTIHTILKEQNEPCVVNVLIDEMIHQRVEGMKRIYTTEMMVIRTMLDDMLWLGSIYTIKNNVYMITSVVKEKKNNSLVMLATRLNMKTKRINVAYSNV